MNDEKKGKVRVEPSGRLMKLPPYLFGAIDVLKRDAFSKKLDGIPPQEAASMIIGTLNKLWSEAGLD